MCIRECCMTLTFELYFGGEGILSACFGAQTSCINILFSLTLCVLMYNYHDLLVLFYFRMIKLKYHLNNKGK